MKKQRTLLVGLGNIGVGYDLDGPKKSFFTHAKALTHHPRFELIGGVDPSEKSRYRFEQKYGLPTYPSMASLSGREAIDGVVFASPTSTHLSIVGSLEASPLRFVMVEKPVGVNARETEACLSHIASLGARAFVNYIRRATAGAKEIQEGFATGRWGQPMGGTLRYSGSLRNSACHFLNLLELWLGEPRQVLSLGGSPTAPNFLLRFDTHSIYCLAMGESAPYSVGEIEIWCQNGLLRYGLGGEKCEWAPILADRNFPGEKALSRSNQEFGAGLDRYQYEVYDEISGALEAGRESALDGSAALATSRLLDQIETHQEFKT